MRPALRGHVARGVAGLVPGSAVPRLHLVEHNTRLLVLDAGGAPKLVRAEGQPAPAAHGLAGGVDAHPGTGRDVCGPEPFPRHRVSGGARAGGRAQPGLRVLRELLEKVPDPRRGPALRPPRGAVLSLSTLAKICGWPGVRQPEACAKAWPPEDWKAFGCLWERRAQASGAPSDTTCQSLREMGTGRRSRWSTTPRLVPGQLQLPRRGRLAGGPAGAGRRPHQLRDAAGAARFRYAGDDLAQRPARPTT